MTAEIFQANAVAERSEMFASFVCSVVRELAKTSDQEIRNPSPTDPDQRDFKPRKALKFGGLDQDL